MNFNFTISLTPELDFAYLKVKNAENLKAETKKHAIKSDLGSSDKPLNSSLKENKDFRLREKTEKYRLNETKRLMRLGLDFEKARKEAFKKSLMSNKDKRKFEYKNLKEQGIAVSKFSKAIDQIKKNTSFKMQAMASGVGSVVGGSLKDLASYAFNLIKKGLVEDTEKELNKRSSRLVFNSKQDKEIEKMITEYQEIKNEKGEVTGKKYKYRGFDTELQRSDFKRQVSGLMPMLHEYGIKDWASQKKMVELAARFTTSGQSSTQEIISAIEDHLSGGNRLNDMMKGVGWKIGKGEAYMKEFGYEAQERRGFRASGMTRGEYNRQSLKELLNVYHKSSYLETGATSDIEEMSKMITTTEDVIKNVGLGMLKGVIATAEAGKKLGKVVGDVVGALNKAKDGFLEFVSFGNKDKNKKDKGDVRAGFID